MLKSCTTKKYYYSFFNFFLLAIPYESCIHILAMEKFLEVYDKKFGIDAEDFFMESMCCGIFFQNWQTLSGKNTVAEPASILQAFLCSKTENNQRNELR